MATVGMGSLGVEDDVAFHRDHSMESMVNRCCGRTQRIIPTGWV